MSKNINVPKLRFSEFGGEWEEKKIGAVTTYVDYRGRAPIKTENGNFLVTAKNIKKGFIDYECSKEYVSEDNYLNVMSKGLPEIGDVLFTTEAPMGNVAQVDVKNIALAQRVIKFRAKKMLLNSYLFHYMLSDIFQSLITKKSIGTTVQGISGKELHQTKLAFPSLEEQEKIASFLTSVDIKIEQLTKKETLLQEYKKGVMNKIFNQEIRFKDDNGSEFSEWEKFILEKVCKIKKGTQLNKDTLTFKGIYPALNGGINPSGYTTEWNTEENTITISEGGNSCGFVNFMKEKFWSGGHNYSLQELNNNLIFNDFLYQYLKFNELSIMSLRVGSGLPNIQKTALSKFIVSIPSIQEQTKIANFLSSIDKKIELTTKELNSTKEFKKALLQQMFV